MLFGVNILQKSNQIGLKASLMGVISDFKLSPVIPPQYVCMIREYGLCEI